MCTYIIYSFFWVSSPFGVFDAQSLATGSLPTVWWERDVRFVWTLLVLGYPTMSQPRAERPPNIPSILGLVTYKIFFFFFLLILFVFITLFIFFVIVLLSSLVSLCSCFIGKSSLSRIPLESGCIATPDSLVGLVRLLVYSCIVYWCLGFHFFWGVCASWLIPCCSPSLFWFCRCFSFFFWPIVFSFSASRFPGFYVWLAPWSTCFGRTFLRWFVAERIAGPCPLLSCEIR